MPTTEKKPDGLAAALAELQTQLPKVPKDQIANAGTYSYRYADLASISEHLMPLMGKLGLSFIAKPTLKDGQFILAYSLLHTSGEREEGEYPLPTGNPQAIGSAVSYGRRYCLCAVTGVAPDEGDDDGRAAAEAHREREREQAQQPAAEGERKPSQGLMAALHASFADLGITEREDKLAYAAKVLGRDIDTSKELTRAEASKVVGALKADLDAAVKADAESTPSEEASP